MALVKSLIVKLKADGADTTKHQIDDVGRRAREVGAMDPTIKMKVEDREAKLKLDAMRLELRALKLAGGDTETLKIRIKQVGESAQTAAVKMAALRLELDAINQSEQAANAGASGAAGGIQAGPAMWIAIAAAAVVAAQQVASILPPLAAAGIGIGAFAALALPTLKKLQTAYTGITAAQKNYTAAVQLEKLDPTTSHATAVTAALDKLKLAWRNLSPAQRTAVHEIQGVSTEFKKLQAQMAPMVDRILATGLGIVKKLLPELLPFARAAGTAIEGLLKQFDKFSSSPGFKTFMAQMLKMTGPAIKTIGQGIGRIGVALGKFLELATTSSSLKDLARVFGIIATSVRALGVVFNTLNNVIAGMTATSGASIGRFAHDVSSAFSGAGKDIQTFGAGVGLSVGLAAGDIEKWVADVAVWLNSVATYFHDLPVKIGVALSGLVSELFADGQRAIQGLLNGIESMAGSVIAAAQKLASSVAGALAGVFQFGSPSKLTWGYGVNIGLGLIKGLLSTDKTADAAAKKIADIIKARLATIRQFADQITQSMISFASLTSATTGPNYAPDPHWIRAHGGHPGNPGSTTYSHTGGGVTTGRTAGTKGTKGHWAGGVKPITAGQLLRNMNLDLGRLRKFGHAIARLRKMGLDNTLLQQIIAAGPDQGYQIADAILDAAHPRGEIWQLNRAEGNIHGVSKRIGLAGAQSQFGHGSGNVTINVRGLLMADRKELARMIQKILAELKRHNGGANLGLA